MIHLKLYNESAGQLWSQVTVREMATRMKGQQVDTFTTGEVKKILTLVEGLDGYNMVSESEASGKTLNLEMFEAPTRDLRHHFFGQDTRTKLIYPLVDANNVFIEHSDWCYIDICKSVDDWFYVYARYDYTYYICDGIQGLLNFLSDFVLNKKTD